MNEVEKSVLARFKTLLLKQVTLHKLILFGSRARGDADPYSDMDVVIIVDGTADQAIRDYISHCAWEAGFQQGIVVVPVVFTRDEWENGPERHSLLVQAVKTDGITL
jgi:DNA polymerase sigma